MTEYDIISERIDGTGNVLHIFYSKGKETRINSKDSLNSLHEEVTEIIKRNVSHIKINSAIKIIKYEGMFQDGNKK